MTTPEPTTAVLPSSTRLRGSATAASRSVARSAARSGIRPIDDLDGHLDDRNPATTYTIIGSPLGRLTLTACQGGLTGVSMTEHARMPASTALRPRTGSGFEEATRQLGEYFAGQRTRFSISTCAHGTDFQRRVWRLLSGIPYGRTWTYTQVAAALGRPERLRAVGSAIGRNPLSILVPCHRVVGADGSLTGFSAGLDRKRLLLELEGLHVDPRGRIDGTGAGRLF